MVVTNYLLSVVILQVLLINGVIAPFSRVITPVTHLFSANYRACRVMMGVNPDMLSMKKDIYPSSHNHGSVENDPIVKETSLGGRVPFFF